MIFNIRGTHGSGKSTLVRRIMELYESRTPRAAPGRSRPIGYDCTSRMHVPLFVPGSYETPTGGCDTISEVATTYELVATYAAAGRSVLFEGILAQHSSGRLVALHDTHPVTMIALSTPLEICVESVVARRASRGVTDEFDPKNVNKEFRSVQTAAASMKRKDGLETIWMSREEAFEFVREQLRVTNAEGGISEENKPEDQPEEAQ